MATLTPILTTTPNTPPSYNVGMAETFSWIPIDGADRPLFARAMYLANPGDISVSLSAGDLNVNLGDVETLTQESNTLLGTLTSIQTLKQNEIITLLRVLTGSGLQVDLNTDQLEARVEGSNTLLGALTSIQTLKQNEIITLLHAITASTLQVDLNTDQLEVHVDGVETLLQELTASNKVVPGFSIPSYDEIQFEYVSATDIFRKVTYLNNSTQVMALSFTYSTEPPTSGNANIQSVKKI
jgi:hypothetical protein